MINWLKKSDEKLAVQAIDDQDALYQLMKRYEQKLLRYIRRMTKVSEAGAEDILQEVFIKMYRNLNGFNANLKFSSWIYRITHNEIISQHRKKQARAKTVSIDGDENGQKNLAHLIKDTIDLEKEMITKEIIKKVREVIEVLPDKYREVLILRYLEDKDYSEISDILQKPTGTIATLLNRAKEQFKKTAIQYKLDTLI